MPDPQNIDMFAGDSKRLTITVKDEDDAIVDVSGGSAELRIARKVDSSAVLTATGTVNADSPNTGVITFDLPKGTTSGLEGTYYWEAEYEDASSPTNVYTVAFGYITFRPDLVP